MELNFNITSSTKLVGGLTTNPNNIVTSYRQNHKQTKTYSINQDRDSKVLSYIQQYLYHKKKATMTDMGAELLRRQLAGTFYFFPLYIIISMMIRIHVIL